MEESKGFSKDAIVRINNERDIVTKRILKIIEDKEGEINPITNLHESPVYHIMFDDATERKLFRHKMIEYLSMAYGKSVQKFKKVIVVTDVSSTVVWVVVTQDYQLDIKSIMVSRNHKYFLTTHCSIVLLKWKVFG